MHLPLSGNTTSPSRPVYIYLATLGKPKLFVLTDFVNLFKLLQAFALLQASPQNTCGLFALFDFALHVRTACI